MSHLIQITRNIDKNGNSKYAGTKTFSFPQSNSVKIQISGLDSNYDAKTVNFEVCAGQDSFQQSTITGSNILGVFDGTGGTQNTANLTQVSSVSAGVSTFFIAPSQSSDDNNWIPDNYYTFYLAWELADSKQEIIKFEAYVKKGRGV